MLQTINEQINQLGHTGIEILHPIEECVNRDTYISDALRYMAEYRCWSGTTLENYTRDVMKFEEFLMRYGMDPSLKNGGRLHVVDRWVKEQKEAGAASKTICRRIASLSSIYTFYGKDELKIVQSNPFKALKVRSSDEGSYSLVMDLDDMKKVYVAIQELKEKGIDIEIPIKLLMFTGLRNHSYSFLKVKDINWEQEALIYNSGIDNNKHKIQVFPLPPKFMSCLKEYIELWKLQPDDPICYGLKGMPLLNKQLNRITNTLCSHLGWNGERKVTPHGFRASLSTLLDENNVPQESIRYLLGHSEIGNIRYYIKRDRRKIFEIKTVLVWLEEQLESHFEQVKSNKANAYNNNMQHPTSKLDIVQDNVANNRNGGNVQLSTEILIKLIENPELGRKLIENPELLSLL